MFEDLFENQNFIEPSQFGVLIQSNSIYLGISLAEINLPEKCAVLGILREGKIISALYNPSIYPGDYILAIAINPMMVPALKVTLKKTHPVYYSFNNCLFNTPTQPNQASNSIDSSKLTNSTSR